MSFASDTKERVTVSLPPPLLEAADRVAEQLDRSRSWVVSRALESFLAPQGGNKESGAAVGAQDVAGLSYPRNASPGSNVAGGGTFSKEVDAQMANYTVTPEAAPAVRATLGLHVDTLQRAAEQSRRVAADQQRVREDTDRRNAAYLTGKTAA